MTRRSPAPPWKVKGGRTVSPGRETVFRFELPRGAYFTCTGFVLEPVTAHRDLAVTSFRVDGRELVGLNASLSSAPPASPRIGPVPIASSTITLALRNATSDAPVVIRKIELTGSEFRRGIA